MSSLPEQMARERAVTELEFLVRRVPGREATIAGVEFVPIEASKLPDKPAERTPRTEEIEELSARAERLEGLAAALREEISALSRNVE